MKSTDIPLSKTDWSANEHPCQSNTTCQMQQGALKASVWVALTYSCSCSHCVVNFQSLTGWASMLRFTARAMLLLKTKT
eukprot:874243-Amphidinium_carterae.1